MTGSKITSKGQITVPKVVRETLAVKAGDRVRFVIHDNGAVTMEADTVDLPSLQGMVKRTGRHVTIEQMNDAIKRGGTRK